MVKFDRAKGIEPLKHINHYNSNSKTKEQIRSVFVSGCKYKNNVSNNQNKKNKYLKQKKEENNSTPKADAKINIKKQTTKNIRNYLYQKQKEQNQQHLPAKRRQI